ncbi:MAG: hypothetical protein KIT31_26200 [Deltaproteobacteria bacterium]|nr:hypothetical protein [Deltaproteobacteria bacterium]
MASIRIVDTWMRSPASPPSHYRSVMVIAEKWAEQRVLMRAYADSRDQTRPTIVLHGMELAIGPAGVDINGPWGIHVGSQPTDGDGRAQEIKVQLEGAARRIAGSKGNPPRLQDEEPTFDREPTANWGPGAPRILPKRPEAFGQPVIEHVAVAGAARLPVSQHATYVPQGLPGAPQYQQHQPTPSQPEFVSTTPSNPELRKTPLPLARARSKTRNPPLASHHKGTALGYTSGAGAQSAVVRLGLAPHVSARLGWLVARVVPPDFHIDLQERRVLNALGERQLTARAIGQMLDVADAVSYMEELVKKLEAYNLDLVEPGEPHGGEPTYRMRAG